ncbi:MAG: CaiB/BaiF CoA transferase family protein [Dehalococcoidia bacterium]
MQESLTPTLPDLLECVLVLDLGRGHAGPYCARMLMDAGATVIHVEHPRGDPLRNEGAMETSFSPAFAFLNGGKQSITLDYTTVRGRALLADLVARASILVENGRPGTLERHGIGMSELLDWNPALVRVSITNFGLTGPHRDFEASEMTLQAASGLMDGNGDAHREPLRYPMNLAQHWAGSNAAYAGLVAYWHALRTGAGQQVDVSIQESITNTWYLNYADYQYTGSLQTRGQRDLLPASDGDIMVRWQPSVPYRDFLEAMNAPELIDDPELQPPAILGAKAGALREALREHSPELTRAEWLRRGVESRIPVGAMQDLREIEDCEQHSTREFWDYTTDSKGSRVTVPGRFYLIDGQPQPAQLRAVPTLGEHNALVYGGLLGRSSEDLAVLQREGAI